MKQEASIDYINSFIDGILSKVLHHHNHPKLFRPLHSKFPALFDSSKIYIDFFFQGLVYPSET